MAINSTVRQLKIALITDQPNEILSWFEDLCSKLHVKNVRVYNNHGKEYVYYFQKIDKDGILKQFPILYYDRHTESLSCDYRHFWAKFEVNFDMDYDDVVEITICLVEHVLKIKALHPEGEALYFNESMINALNNPNETNP